MGVPIVRVLKRVQKQGQSLNQPPSGRELDSINHKKLSTVKA